MRQIELVVSGLGAHVIVNATAMHAQLDRVVGVPTSCTGQREGHVNLSSDVVYQRPGDGAWKRLAGEVLVVASAAGVAQLGGSAAAAGFRQLSRSSQILARLFK